ncbi:MAG TPA: DedA family protein [Gaiellales bacterium]|jgi:membrane protein DedA with SNARE-associated domain
MDAAETRNTRWWVPPVLRLAAVFAALAAAAVVIWLVLQRVDAPSAGSLIRDHGYLGVAVGAFGDSFGLPSSGEVVLLLASAAAAASSSHFSIPVVIAVAWGFAVAGDACAYAIGRAAGPRVLRRFGVHEDSSVHGFMERHGARAVLVGRLIAGVRTKLAIVSGSTRMPLHRYIIADGLGAAIWAIGVGLIGYGFSSSVQSLTDGFGSASHAIGGVAIAIVAILAAYLSIRYVLRHRPTHTG